MKAPYDKALWEIRIKFPVEYPFKAPEITFITPIFHPNVDETGKICLNIINPEQWKPATKASQGSLRHVHDKHCHTRRHPCVRIVLILAGHPTLVFTLPISSGQSSLRSWT